MNDNIATYHIETDKVYNFKSNIPVSMLQDFLQKEDNRFDFQRFVNYVESFRHIKKYIINVISE